MDPYAVEPDIPTLLATNAVPGPFTSYTIRRAIERLNREVALTYLPIFPCSREEILTTRSVLLYTIKNYQGILSAVRRITNDVWVRIFSFNAADYTELHNYRLVSRSWRLAADNPTLWTGLRIHLIYDQDYNRVRVSHLAEVLNYFTFVRSLPLDVKIVYDIPADAFGIGRCDVELLPNKDRWRSLTTHPGLLVMMLPHWGPFFEILEEVIILSGAGEDDGDIEGLWMLNLPHLKKLTMKVKTRVNTESIKVSWHKITHLSVDSKHSTASDLLEILHHCCYNLESCEIKLNDSSYSLDLLPHIFRNPLTMPKIKRFRVLGRQCPALFLSFFRMPQLEAFEIGWNDEDSSTHIFRAAYTNIFRIWLGERIAHFVRSSGCPVKVFWVQEAYVRSSGLVGPLAAMREALRDAELLLSNFGSIPANVNNRAPQMNA